MSTDEQKSAILQQKYNKFQGEITDMQEQLGTLSSQLQEHLIVDKTLTGISPDQRQGRKCFKMIGGVLVEKTVDEVIKLLNEEVKTLENSRSATEKQLTEARKNMDSWIKTNGIKIVRQ